MEMNEFSFGTKASSNESDVIQFYEDYAASWDTRFGECFSSDYFVERRWKSFEQAIVQQNVNKGLAVELGVGTGVYISRLSSIFEHIVAVDGSQEMLNQLNNKLNKFNIQNVTTINSDVLNISQIEDSSVDCIYFFGLIEHIVDIDSFVKEIKRQLKKGGVCIGVTPNGRSPWYKLRSLVRGTGRHCSTDRYYTSKQLDQLFLPNNFERSYVNCWGAVPAGIDDRIGKPLAFMEPVFEKSPVARFLGGITFAYRLN
jgi:ubiquinone/menaquinone biosynthesis C-methylase UbiE